MADSPLNPAERPLQPLFSFRKLIFLLSLVFLVFALANDSLPEVPNRTPLPERLVAVRFKSLPLPTGEGPMNLTGLWRVEAADPRFGGLSGLAILSPDRLVAVTDSGSLIDLPKPGEGQVARVFDLQGGPGWPTFKKYRDAEALLSERNPKTEQTALRITFENRHSLFLYDERGRSIGGTLLPQLGWATNKGAEALTRDSAGNLIIIGENGRDLLVGRPDSLQQHKLTGATGGVADAVRLPDGRVLVAVREVGLGLTNRLAWLERSGADYRLRPFAVLPLGWADNVEGLAAEPLPGGATRIWAVTDNDFNSRRPTLLTTFDLPPASRAQHNGR